MCNQVPAAFTQTDLQAGRKCVNQLNCLEIQHNEHPKVASYWLVVACLYLLPFIFFLNFLSGNVPIDAGLGKEDSESCYP